MATGLALICKSARRLRRQFYCEASAFLANKAACAKAADGFFQGVDYPVSFGRNQGGVEPFRSGDGKSGRALRRPTPDDQ